MDNSRLPVDKPGHWGQVGRYKGTRGHHRRPEPVDKPVDKSAGASVHVSCILSVLPVRPFRSSCLSVCPSPCTHKVSVYKPHNVLSIKHLCYS